MSFKALGLSAELIRAVEEEGYHEPTPIQQQVIPVVLKKRDVMAAAQTGTGKTAGFTLPLLQNLSQVTPQRERGQLPIRALILTPTRELAAQVAESVRVYGKYLPLKSLVVFGGVKINPQMVKLRHGVDILIATPGRLLDLLQQNALRLSSVETLVLDEADRMLDMGFINDILRIIKLLPKRRQNLLFSATFSKEIKELAHSLLHAPVSVEVASPNSTAEGISQIVYPVDKKRKRELLSHLIRSNGWRQALVFVRTKHSADHLAKQLYQDGITTAAIHGGKSQGGRTRALDEFKKGDIRVLVATDIAARGLDIDKLPHVVNFDLPNVPEDYVHRIGRTGRAKNEGSAISLVCIDERDLLKDIEKVLKYRLPQQSVPGFEPDPSIKKEPIHDKRTKLKSAGSNKPNANKPKRKFNHSSEKLSDREREFSKEGGFTKRPTRNSSKSRSTDEGRTRRYANDDSRSRSTEEKPKRLSTEGRARSYSNADGPRSRSTEEKPKRFSTEGRARSSSANSPRSRSTEEKPKRLSTEGRARSYSNEDGPRSHSAEKKPRKFSPDRRSSNKSSTFKSAKPKRKF